MNINPRKLKKKGKSRLAEAEYLLKRARKALPQDVIKAIQESIQNTRTSLKGKDWQSLEQDLEKLENLIEEQLSAFQPNRYWETLKALLVAVAIALFIRWLFIEPFRIPSGSMVPTLLVGDQLMVNKLVYGPNIPFTTKKLFMPREPKRGDVIVFKYPHDISEDYIKRVVGLPGDRVLVADGNLFINGQKVEKIYNDTVPYDVEGCSFSQGCDVFTEQMGEASHPIYLCHRNHFGINYQSDSIPEGQLFVMGDNRDTSRDSRDWGFVPFSHLKGKAMFIHLSLDPDHHYKPRWKRFFKWIK
jgi:signal peptidase I